MGNQFRGKQAGDRVSGQDQENSILLNIVSMNHKKPMSLVLPSEPTQESTAFQMKWTGKNGGAGIQDYTIFVSENAETYTVSLPDTVVTSASFRGGPGKRYAF